MVAEGKTIGLVSSSIAAHFGVLHASIVNNGHIVHEGPAGEIKVQPDLLKRYLGV